MKVKNLLVLLVLALSFAFVGLGCGPEEEDEAFPASFPSELTAMLKNMGVSAFDEPVGDNVKYEKWLDASTTETETVFIQWTGCTAQDFAAYSQVYAGYGKGSRAFYNDAFANLDMAAINFYATGADANNNDPQKPFTVEAGSIVFMGAKTKVAE